MGCTITAPRMAAMASVEGSGGKEKKIEIEMKKDEGQERIKGGVCSDHLERDGLRRDWRQR